MLCRELKKKHLSPDFYQFVFLSASKPSNQNCPPTLPEGSGRFSVSRAGRRPESQYLVLLELTLAATLLFQIHTGKQRRKANKPLPSPLKFLSLPMNPGITESYFQMRR